MLTAQDKRIAATMSVSEWFNDLLFAIEGILPTWAESYGINVRKEVANETLTVREVANELRRIAERGKRRGIRVSRGAFGPTFAGDDSQADGAAETKDG